jgi:pimeloyl-ACP methyl ester carboxylesterase
VASTAAGDSSFTTPPAGGWVGTRADVEGAIAALPDRASGPLLDQAPATITFDAGEAGRWVLKIAADGEIERASGPGDRHQAKPPSGIGAAAATITSDAGTLAAVITGRDSGIGAFLDGRLTVRGSLGLSLQLEGALAQIPRPDRFPRPDTVTVEDIRTPYLDAGPRDAPVVVALHGLGATNASMLPIVWDLADEYRVIAPDLPGFGTASKPLTGYTAKWFGWWLQRFCDALGLDEFFLLGNSLGGRVSIEGGLRMPERVKALVLYTPSPAFMKARQLTPLARLLRPEFAALPLPLTHGMTVSEIKKMFARPSVLPDSWFDAAADEFRRVFSTYRGRVAFAATARHIYLEEAYGSDGFWQRLPGLQPPALFVWGEKDRLVPHGFSRHVVAALPLAESVVLPDCGHVPQFELREQTQALTRAFLTRWA